MVDLTPILTEAASRGVVSIGVGDAGNEIGFGRIFDAVREIQEPGAVCQCPRKDGMATITSTDILVVASVSNWGCYAIDACLAHLTGQENLPQSAKTAERVIGACFDGGGYEAVFCTQRNLVDGVAGDDEALELMIDHSTYIVPTLLAGHQIVSNGHAGRVPPWITEKSLASAEHHRESFAAAVKSGLKIAAGTDAGTPFNPHGLLAAELKLMVDYGLSPADAIVAATRNAAENLGLLGDTGTVEGGKRADLILVDGDPTADISCLSCVSRVISNGMTIGEPGRRG